LYVGKTERGLGKVFGVNFADGRIKGYGVQVLGGGAEKTFFVLCVRAIRATARTIFTTTVTAPSRTAPPA